MRPFRLLLLFMIFTLFSGCTSLDQLKKAERKGNRFQSILADDYLGFAESLSARYDFIDSLHFARKGLDSANGRYVLPENYNNWRIDDDDIPTVKQAYKYLTKILKTEGVRQAYPENAAQAQFMFDCWMENLEEGWQIEKIKTCREDFYNQLDQLFLAISPVKPMAEQEQMPDSEQKPQKATMSHSYDINFANGGTKLYKLAQSTIKRIVNDLKGKTNYQITLNGYTDKTGKPKSNMELSKKRAMSVKEALVAAGLDANKITVFGFGQYDVRIPTKQGQPEPRNRMVEAVVEM